MYLEVEIYISVQIADAVSNTVVKIMTAVIQIKPKTRN